MNVNRQNPPGIPGPSKLGPRSALGEISNRDFGGEGPSQIRKAGEPSNQADPIHQKSQQMDCSNNSSAPFQIHCDVAQQDENAASKRFQGSSKVPNHPKNMIVPRSELIKHKIPLSWKSRLGDLPFAIYCDEEEPIDKEKENKPPIENQCTINRSQTVPANLDTMSQVFIDEDSNDVLTLEVPVLASSKDSPSYSQNESINSNEDDEEVMVTDDSDCDQESMEEDAYGDEELLRKIKDQLNKFVVEEDYRHEIYAHLIELQHKYKAKWNYMSKQPDINYNMRSILVDWLVEVGEEYKLNNETVHLAVNYVDRFLSAMSVQRAKLQLVGAACMFIAAKYEEIYPPDVAEFVYITDDTYNKKQILRMEQLVLKELNFDLAAPTIFNFLTQFAKETDTDERTTFLAMYLSELTLLDAETYLPFANNVIAAAALALARHTCGVAAWPQSMVEMAKLTVDDFKECLIAIHGSFTRAPTIAQQSIREKYKSSKFLEVSTIEPVPIS